ncbi:MAG: leucine-rich repeat domain-containing protein [Oscillospiraceae bacterium]|nr:leucine-rich repeat domain-containing protein [Oscillospiraceae bacterium]
MQLKHFASALLSACMLAAAVPAVPASAETADFSYTVLEDGSVSVYCNDPELTEVQVPASIDGYSVSALADSCFSQNAVLTEITLPDGLKSIGDMAFYGCESLAGITLPEGLDTIGSNAFTGCSSITEFHIPASVTEIGAYAFDTTENLTAFSAATDNAVYTVQDGVLFDKEMSTLIKYPEARQETAYTVPDSCTSVMDWAFIGTQNLEQIDLNNVTAIGEDAFYYCIKLKSVTIPEGVIDLIGGVFCYCVELESVVLPSTLKTIGENCFYSCTALKDITLPEGLEKIGAYAFFHCTSLDSLTVPKSVITVTSCCMGYCYDEAAEGTAVQEGFTLYVTKGSPAHTYASSNGIAWEKAANPYMLYYILIGAAAVIIIGLAAGIAVVLRKRKE